MESDINTHQFQGEILRSYDIRGIVGKTLNDIDAQLLGNILAQITFKTGGHYIVVGYDGRLTANRLFQAFCKGANDFGCTIITIGECATPQLYFAGKAIDERGLFDNTYKNDAPFAVMITGSHNPKEYNGFKMVHYGKPFWGDDIQQLTQYSYRKFADMNKNIIDFGNDNIHHYYVNILLERTKLATENCKIVWDLGNGALCHAFKKLQPRLAGTHIVLFGEVDGNFPNHHPDPTVESNLVDLKQAVKDNQADMGIAFDGDGDRIGVVDADGVVLWGDQLLAILARPIIAQNPNAKIIADVKASQAFFDEITNLGGTPIMAPTGHSIIKSKMHEHNALLAGEMSGHIFFKDRWFGFDDALYAALRLIELCQNDRGILSNLRKNLPQYYNTPEIRIDIDESIKFKIMLSIKKHCDLHNIVYDDCDGVRALNPDGWWLVRASNTQNCLVLRAEGANPQTRDIYEQRARAIINQCLELL